MQKHEFLLLGFSSGNSDKQYKIMIQEETNGTYSAIGLYGRRGRLTSRANLETNTTLVAAINAARKTEAAKLKKGYTVESKSAGWSTFASFSNAPASSPAPALGMSKAERELASMQTEWF